MYFQPKASAKRTKNERSRANGLSQRSGWVAGVHADMSPLNFGFLFSQAAIIGRDENIAIDHRDMGGVIHSGDPHVPRYLEVLYQSLL